MRGLLRYLVTTESRDDPRANQHEHPRVVAGDRFLTNVYTEELKGDKERDDGRAIADYLDRPRVLYGVDVTSRRWVQEAGTGQRVAVLDKDGGQAVNEHHVWHASLSLADDESRTDEQWERIARGFMDKMEFTEASGKSPCRWVAIHHGAGAGGHDHVHVVASVARQDGTRWAVWPDFTRAQQACRELEREHGLTRVEGREFGTAMPGLNPAEKRLEEKHRDIRQDLAGRVRAAAVASSSEVEWIRRLRDDGVTLKPRFAPETTDVVVGYRAGLNLATEGKPEWRFYGGGTLGRDLSLPRLRECWPDTVEHAQAASEEWQRAYRGRDPVKPPHAPQVSAEDAVRTVQGFRDRLGSVPVYDRLGWSQAAHDVSGALSAWARVDDQHAAELGQAAGVIGRSAQDRHPGIYRRPASSLAPALLFLAMDKPTTATKTALATALIDCARAFAHWHAASMRRVEADRVRAAGVTLEETRRRMGTDRPGVTVQRATDREQALTARAKGTRGMVPIGTPTTRSAILPNDPGRPPVHLTRGKGPLTR